MAGGILLSFGSGIALALANDFYKHKMKDKVEKILKPKNDENKNDKAA